MPLEINFIVNVSFKEMVMALQVYAPMFGHSYPSPSGISDTDIRYSCVRVEHFPPANDEYD